MRILLLAPQPFYQDRGTPIAVDLLLRAFSARGDVVDVLTFQEGADRQYPGVTLHRIPRLPLIRHVPPGLSVRKLVCDVFFYRRAARLMRATRYDVVHAIEEAAFMARCLGRRHGVPYVVDMDSSMPLQIVEKLPALAWLRPLMQRLETGVLRDAAGVLAVCDALADIARAAGARHVTVLRDISLLELLPPPDDTPPLPRPPGARTVFLYVGNLERYQGVDLLLEAWAHASLRLTDAALVVVGGPAHIEPYRRRAEALGIADRVQFTGPRPLAHLPRLLADADVLVSPRIRGNNTPMKIYSYLDAGRAVLATALPTHTQVMTADMALLCDPTPEAFAEGLARLAGDPDLRRSLAAAAQARARRDFSFAAYRRTLDAFYAEIAPAFPRHRHDPRPPGSFK